MSCLSLPQTRSGVSFLPYRSFSCYYFLVSSPAQSLIPYNVISAPIFQIIYCLGRFHYLLPLLSLDTSNNMLFSPGFTPISFLTPLQQFLAFLQDFYLFICLKVKILGSVLELPFPLPRPFIHTLQK